MKSPRRRSYSHSRSPDRRRRRSPSYDRYEDRRHHDDRRHRSPKGGVSNPPAEHPDANPGNNLYISNLSRSTEESDLRASFEKYGCISDIRIVRDPNTKESRGFGFVTFKLSSDADEAVRQMDNTELQGKEIKVEKARRCRPHDPTPGEYCGPLGASSKYRMTLQRRRRSPSPLRHRSRSRSRSR
jgi:transformer-2 protein